MQKFDWKKWSGLGLFIYLLSLPIMIWRSSKMGRVISIVVLVVSIVNLSVWASRKSVEAYLNFKSVFEIQSKGKELVKELYALKLEVGGLRSEVKKAQQKFYADYKEKIDVAVDAEISKLSSYEAEGEKIEKAIAVVKDEERQHLKERVFELMENVKLKKESLTTFKNRASVERVIENLDILVADDKTRLLKEMEQIGVKVIETEKKVVKRVPMRMVTSRDGVSWGGWQDDN